MKTVAVDMHPASELHPDLRRWRVIVNNLQVSMHPTPEEARDRAFEYTRNDPDAGADPSVRLGGGWVTIRGNPVFIGEDKWDEKKQGSSGKKRSDGRVPGKKFTPDSGKDTLDTYRTPDGKWDPEREAFHDQIVEDATKNVPVSSDPTVHLLGGGPGAGKTSLLREGLVKLPDNTEAVWANPDMVVSKLPEWDEIKDNPKAGSMTHEEGAHVAARITKTALDSKKDLVIDASGNGGYDKLAGKIAAYRAAGYKVNATYVTTDIEEAWRRAEVRASSPGPEHGRRLPTEYFKEVHRSISAMMSRAHSLFDKVEIYDRNGRPSKLIATGGRSGLKIHDQTAWKRFLAKATWEGELKVGKS